MTATIFDLASLPTAVQVIDGAMLVLGIFYVYGARRSWPKQPDGCRPAGELDRAASAVGTFITVGVLGASVLLTGSGIVLGLGSDKRPLPVSVSTELTIAIGALVVSMLSGAASASYVLNHLHHKASVVEQRTVVGTAAAQLVAMVVGAVAFMLALLLL